MIRKSAWLLSAGLMHPATPAFAQTATSNTDTDKQTAQPTPGATEGAAVAGSGAAAAAGRHRRHRHHRDAPQPGAVRRADGGQRGHRAEAAVHRRDRHPAAEPGVAVAARLLDLVGSGRSRRANPRHRHGRRQSRPRRLGRRVHRRRLSLARRHRPDRARPARPDRSAARPAGHAVRPQHLGRPDLDHHRQAALHAGSRAARSTSAITTIGACEASITGPVERHHRGASRRRLGQARRLPQGRGLRAASQRPRPLDAAWAGAVPAERQFLVPPHRRLFASGTRNAARAAYLPAFERVTAAAGHHSHRRSPASSARSAAIIEDDPYQRKVSITPGRNYAADVNDWGLSGEAVYDFGWAELTSITAYRYNKYDRGQDADFNNLDILYPRRTTAGRSTASRPSARSCGSRAMPSTTGSTGWSAAITRTRSCGSTTISPTATITPATPTAWSRRIFAA